MVLAGGQQLELPLEEEWNFYAPNALEQALWMLPTTAWSLPCSPNTRVPADYNRALAATLKGKKITFRFAIPSGQIESSARKRHCMYAIFFILALIPVNNFWLT